MRKLKQFQKFSFHAIKDQLKGRGKRFLLADEVGLGKTIVARHVLDDFCKNKENKVVIYLCSSLEIAGQNISKLMEVSEEENYAVDRLTLLGTLEEIEKKKPTVFCFTPGTSLDLGNAQGMMYERAFLYVVLKNVLMWGRFSRSKDLFFAGRANLETGTFLAARDRYQELVRGRLPFYSAIKKEFKERIKLLPAPSDYPGTLEASVDAIGRDLDSYHKETVEYKKANAARNSWIGALREALAASSLKAIDPSLIILDEFQKFPDVLETALKDKDSLTGQLLGSKSPVLLLSATPYKWYTTAKEDGSGINHFEEFKKTLQFLAGNDQSVNDLTEKLEEFKGLMLKVDASGLLSGKTQELKGDIEDILRQYLCRTERYPFIDSTDKGGVEEILPEDEDVSVSELKEYFALQRKAKKHKLPFPMSFWKSGAYLSSFMKDYSSVEEFIHTPDPEDSELFLNINKLKEYRPIDFRNKKVKHVISDYVVKQKAWEHLWISPLNRYYKTDLEDAGPQKLLVFSAWKFVPSMVAALASYETERMLSKSHGKKGALKLEGKAVAKFYPSYFLAHIPVVFGTETKLEDVRLLLKKTISEGLESLGIYKGNPNCKLDELIHLIDLECFKKINFKKDPWEQAEIHGRGGDGEEREDSVAFSEVKDTLRNIVPRTSLSYSDEQHSELVDICLGGPGVCILRSLLSISKPNEEKIRLETILSTAITLSYGVIRNFFARIRNQQVINSTIRKGFYHEKVVQYCIRNQFQSVIDEWLFQSVTPSSEKDFRTIVEDIETVLKVHQSSIRVNTVDENRKFDDKHSMHLHLARKFGDKAQSDDEADTKNSLRQSFNSPFWPFILATTSVGQEGLDFHLYCDNILHWNLSSNPVDFEQREGRINRCNSFAVRKAITNLYKGIPWDEIYKKIEQSHKDSIRKSLELTPGWLFPGMKIIRKVIPYPLSTDVKRYNELTLNLSIYRIALGQPRQEELLKNLKESCVDEDELRKKAKALMLNLMPFDPQLIEQLDKDPDQDDELKLA